MEIKIYGFGVRGNLMVANHAHNLLKKWPEEARKSVRILIGVNFKNSVVIGKQEIFFADVDENVCKHAEILRRKLGRLAGVDVIVKV